MKIEIDTENPMFIYVVGSVILLCVYLAVYSENVNSFINKHEFDFQGVVYAFPDEKHDKNYRLVADMYKEGNSYYVSRIYFYNGGFIDFDEYGYPLNKKGLMACNYMEYIDDNNEKEWCFRFYGEQVSEPGPKIKRKIK